MIISMNGTLMNDQEAVISIYDHGFLYGMGLFETFRTYGGRPFLLEEHCIRLEEGCRELGIDYMPEPDQIASQASALLAVNGLRDGYFRLSVSAGPGVLGLPAQSYDEPTVVLYVKPLLQRDEAVFRNGKALQLLKLRRNTPEGMQRLKSFHYMNNILAKREMAGYPWAGGAEGLMLTADGSVAEGIVSNVFWFSGGVGFTPSLNTGILPGITRAYVMGLAARSGIPMREGTYVWDALASADEVFLTNSIQEIVPVTSLFESDGSACAVGDGSPGALTRRLMQAYGTLA